MNWYAIYTKPRCEDSSARLLRNAGIEILAPKIQVNKRVRSKYAETIEPLFPSYIFAFFNYEMHGRMIKYTRGVKYIVGKEVPIVVHPEIIEIIREKLVGGIVVQTPDDLVQGDRVLVREGPFSDLYGVFDRPVPGKKRSIILLEALHCRLDIENRSLKKI